MPTELDELKERVLAVEARLAEGEQRFNQIIHMLEKQNEGIETIKKQVEPLDNLYRKGIAVQKVGASFDGTNGRVTITPTANFTGTLTTTASFNHVRTTS
jgi:hypothetical protein